MRAHIKERATLFHRFDALWTPTVVILDASGKEHFRSEGYLPRDEFFAALHLGEARVRFARKQWAEAERIYDEIIGTFGDSASAAEATYWRGVARYKRTNDHTVLHELKADLQRAHPDSVWTKKAVVWGD